MKAAPGLLKAAALFGIAASLSALAGCSSPAAKAKQRYQLLKDEHAPRGEVCQAGRDFIRAVTEAGDTETYRDQRTVVDIDCQHAELTGDFQPYGLPDIEPDNMEAGASVENLASASNPFR